MGCGASTAGAADYKAGAERSKQLDSINKRDNAVDARRVKLLLLGAGESGKSTIFKQMRIIYGTTPYSAEERKQLTGVVHANLVSNARLLVNACQRIVPLQDQTIKQAMDLVPEVEEDVVLDAQLAELLKRVWADAGAQQTWARRSEFQVQDALEWYMTQGVDRLAAVGYVPTVDDILHCRVRTSGIIESTWEIDHVEFVMVDVGGQRNERKKWIHCFQDVTSVMYVAALSEYDQMLYEDDSVPRVGEAVQLFDETINLKHFRRTPILLFLNKSDLFREKLKTVPVRVAGVRFDDFKGPEGVYDAAVEYFLAKFLAKNKTPEEREIYHHVTNATDTNNVRVVFSACKDVILKANLRGSGFMD